MKKITVAAFMLFAIWQGRAQMSNETVTDYGRLRDLSYDLAVNDKIYALTLNNHVVVSYDNGSTWDLLYAFPDNTAILENLKVLSNETLCFSVQHIGSGDGIYFYQIENTEVVDIISLPGGEDELIEVFDVYGDDSSTILLNVNSEATGDKVYFTTTGGENWLEVYDTEDFNNVSIGDVAIGPEDPAKLYLVRGLGPTDVEGGIFISADSGETWTEKLTGVALNSIDINPFDSDDILVGTEVQFGDAFEENIYRSLDGGDTWETQDITWSDDDFQSILEIKFHPSVEGIIFALEDNEIAYTNTNGEAWSSTVYTDDTEYNYGLSLSINPDDTKEAVIGTNFYPVTTSDGGVTVDQIKNPYARVDRVFPVKFDGQEQLYYMIQGGFVHKNYETNMSTAYDIAGPGMIGGGTQVIADPTTEGRVFTYAGGFMGGNLSVSTDNGATKSQILSDFAPNLKAITVDPENSNIIYVIMDNFDQGLLYKLDITDVNAVVNTPITLPDGGTNTPLNGLIVVPTDGDNSLYIIKGNKVYKSVNDGGVWTDLYTAEGAFMINDITVNPFDANEWAIATDDGVFTSTDLGENWTVKLADAAASKVKYSDVEDGVMAVGVYEGGPEDSYITYFNGNGWITVDAEELNYLHSYAMDFNFFGNNIHAYVGTVDMGVLRYVFEILDVAGVENPSATTKEIIVAPNPASGLVTVSAYGGAFEIKNIALYSITGQKVLEATGSSVDVSRLSSGIYIIKAETTSGESISKKLVKQ